MSAQFNFYDRYSSVIYSGSRKELELFHCGNIFIMMTE